MDDPQETERLREEQRARARHEAVDARQADEPAESDQHQRRAEKASYLKEKLDERADSEREQD